MFRISSVVSETGAKGEILWLGWVRFGGEEFFLSFFPFYRYSNFYPLSISPPEGKGRKEDPETRLWVLYDIWCVTVTEILN